MYEEASVCINTQQLGGSGGMPPLSLSPRPKTNPSVDRFQYHTFSHVLYWKRYMRRMRSGDETSPLLLPANPLKNLHKLEAVKLILRPFLRGKVTKLYMHEYLPFLPVAP